METFGTYIKNIREKAGMTRPEVEKAMGAKKGYIRKLEMENRHPEISRVRRLAQILGVNPADITYKMAEDKTQRGMDK